MFTSAFAKFSGLMAAGSLLGSCSETALLRLPHPTDQVQIDSSVIVRQCLPPDHNIVPISTQTGNYDTNGLNTHNQIQDLYQTTFTDNGISLAALLDGTQDYTLMIHGNAYERQDPLIGHTHSRAQIVIVPGNHYQQLKALANPRWLTPLLFFDTEDFPESTLSLACIADFSTRSGSEPIAGHIPYLESYELNLYAGLDFFKRPNWHTYNFTSGIAANFLHVREDNGELWFSTNFTCDQNPGPDGSVSLCGSQGGVYDPADPDFLWPLAAQAFKDHLSDFLDWGTEASALPELDWNENEGSGSAMSAQVYYCHDGQCFQD